CARESCCTTYCSRNYFDSW
nr:immunoglobulin heavy chain junction region [Macaca mulatta]